MMRVDVFGRDAELRLVDDCPAPQRRVSLTAGELLQLGVNHVGYVTAVTRLGGEVEIVIYAANGMTIAKADSVEHAADLANHLGLALVPVH
jgi:hypothetical protein